MANVVVNRVAEFLKRFPPFSFLGQAELEKISSAVEIQFLIKGETLFRQGDPPCPHFFILKEGEIHLTESHTAEEEIKEYLDEGDVFGVLALLGKRPYVLNAKINQDSLIYAIPVQVFEEILKDNSRVALYFAAGFASGQVVVRQDLSQGQKARGVLKNETRDNSLLIFSDQSEVKISYNVLTCDPSHSVQEAAQLMVQADVSSIVIVDEYSCPIGIITDKDLRFNVIAKALPLSTSVSKVMTSPVVTRKKNANFSDLYLTMIKNRLHHLVLTEDGTDQTKVCGILSDHDVLVSMGNSPAVLIHGLLNTQDVKEISAIRNRASKMLAYYLENEVAMDFVASVMTEINDVIIQRAIKIAEESLEKEYPQMQSIRYCFLTLGSEGREEQLLRTDQDNALVYENVEGAMKERAAQYFLKLGAKVVEVLIACGFAPCPGDIMASNPKWVQPLARWQQYFADWILTPTQEALLSASIFFDFRAVSGSKSLSEELSLFIYDSLRKKPVFLNFLAQNTLSTPPPLGFFRNFVVEKSGEHRDQFDIKARAIRPLVDLARLLTLSHGIIGINNTFKRFERLGELEPNYKELFSQAAKAFEILIRIRAIEGMKYDNDGRFIKPESLGKLQRQLLKNTFVPIDELQDIVKVRFQLETFGQ
ncbi:DUF294 nucleotidyltransferase-like domain-containing protein [Algoriphagus sp. AGSA1]|uniref:DUF294 nucleotidyltransferase-like domain-containing protein n=1 Tax=Algoriphagus sp. AGSA1 TaxID=2907213 RepID=UPI001F45135A|nr:DUF294 nucleotidyltransferase-like domain-containing protein [Algoriphagus sp. AGSA1]MCE7055321.1 DUF294 nucleotidyltransferase-like domain-containing protein [Algoriphagus sp. AGSA1]